MGDRVRRRTLLTGGTVVLGLAGCTGPAPPPPPDPLLPVLRSVEGLLASYDEVLRARPSLGDRLDPLRADHRRHAAAVRARLRTPTPRTSGSASPSPSPSPSVVGGDEVATLAAAERREQGAAADRCLTVAGRYARLVGSIAACRATHAVVLGGDRAKAAVDRSGPSPGATPWLQQALAAEHAAVFGYGVIGPRLTGADLRRAQDADEAHRRRRDELTSLLAARRATPTPAHAGYAVRASGRGQALDWAVRLEERTAVVWGSALSALGGTDRAMALDALTDCAVRATAWRPRAGDSPVTVPFPGRS